MKVSASDLVKRYLPESLSPREQVSAFAPSNIALAKYWGKRDTELNLPNTSSLSISLGELGTETKLTCAHSVASDGGSGGSDGGSGGSAGGDRVFLNGTEVALSDPFAKRLINFLDLFRGKTAGEHPLVIETTNTVPTSAGLASSASGFAALTKAIDAYFRLGLSRRVLSALARIGSGSASRSLYNGFVIWHRGRNSDGMDSFAEPISVTWPDLRVGLLVVSSEKKPIDSRTAMNRTVDTSQLYKNWPVQVERDLGTLREAILGNDFTTLARVAEHNAMSMHATMLSAWPPITYFEPETLQALKKVWQLRADGVEVYVTMDAGPNLKLLFESASQADVEKVFPNLQVVSPFVP